LVKKTESKHF